MYEGLDEAAHKFRLAAGNPQSLQMLARHYMQMGYPSALVLSMAQQAKANAAKQSAPIQPGQAEPTTVAQDTLGMAQGGLAGTGMQQGFAGGGEIKFSDKDWKRAQQLGKVYSDSDSSNKFDSVRENLKTKPEWSSLFNDYEDLKKNGSPVTPMHKKPESTRMAHGGPVGLNNIALHRITSMQKAAKPTMGKMPMPQADQRQGKMEKGFALGGLVSFAEGGETWASHADKVLQNLTRGELPRSQRFAGRVAPIESDYLGFELPTGAYNGYKEPYGSPVPQQNIGQQAVAGSGVGAAVTPQSSPGGGGIAAVGGSDPMKLLNDALAKRETVVSPEQAVSERKLMDKAAGVPDDLYGELKSEAGARRGKQEEREREGLNTSQAMALLTAASGMMDVRTGGLSGLLQGLGEAAKVGVPVAMSDDKDYRKNMSNIEDKYAEAMAAYRKGDIDRAFKTAEGAQKILEDSRKRVSDQENREVQARSGIAQADLTGRYNLAGHQASAGAANSYREEMTAQRREAALQSQAGNQFKVLIGEHVAQLRAKPQFSEAPESVLQAAAVKSALAQMSPSFRAALGYDDAFMGNMGGGASLSYDPKSRKLVPTQ